MSKKANVALFNVDGVIVGGKGKSGIMGSTYGADTLITRLHEIARGNKYSGVILRVNSPGGSAAASQEIYELIEEVKASGKFVIASMADVAASGGYMISSACDAIIASPSTMTGSIGVIMALPVYKAVAEKIGYSQNVIKAGELKDIGNPMRTMTAEEETLMQTMADECHDEFIQLVAKGRRKSIEDITALANGMVYTGRQAYNNGLVDSLGNFYTAVDLMKDKLGVDDIKIKEIKTSKGIVSSLLSAVSLADVFKTASGVPKISL